MLKFEELLLLLLLILDMAALVGGCSLILVLLLLIWLLRCLLLFIDSRVQVFVDLLFQVPDVKQLLIHILFQISREIAARVHRVQLADR